MKIHLPSLFKQILKRKPFLLFFTGLLCFFSTMSIAQNMVGEGYQLSYIQVEPYIQVIKRSGKVD